MNTVLDAKGITVRFGGVTALDDVSLAVGEGEVMGLIGPNGAGKSTMLDTVTGFIRPQTGSVVFDGRNISRLQPWRRARLGVGRTFQATELFNDLSLRENLEVTGAEPDAIQGLMEQFEIVPFRDVFAGDLPAGVCRLASIARTLLAYSPQIVLLDEPGAGLLPNEKAKLADTLNALRLSHELSIVLVDHDMSFIGRACSRLVVLDFGKHIAEGTPEEIRNSKVVKDAYLGQ